MHFLKYKSKACDTFKVEKIKVWIYIYIYIYIYKEEREREREREKEREGGKNTSIVQTSLSSTERKKQTIMDMERCILKAN